MQKYLAVVCVIYFHTTSVHLIFLMQNFPFFNVPDLRYYTELTCYELKVVGLSRTVSSLSCEIKIQATILFLCVVVSNCIPVNLPSREEYYNLYWKDIALTRCIKL